MQYVIPGALAGRKQVQLIALLEPADIQQAEHVVRAPDESEPPAAGGRVSTARQKTASPAPSI